MSDVKLVVDWPILTFDRTKDKPLPFETRHYLLDWTKLSQGQAADLKSLIAKDRSREPETPHFGLEETIITWSLNANSPNPNIKKFRPFFVPASVEERQRELHDTSFTSVMFHMVNFGEDHIEDENGAVITSQDVMDHVAGGRALIMYDARSVLRIGPVSIREASNWTLRDSNTVCQFLAVVEHIWKSEWIRVPVSVTTKNKKGQEHIQGEIVNCIFPTPKEITAVVAWFRQLYSSDELFNKASNTYLRFVDHAPKRAWYKAVKDRFNEARYQAPDLSPGKEYNRRELLDVFAYGARIIHSESQSNAESKLDKLIGDHGRENVALAINSSMRDLFGYASLAYHCLKQDFTEWVRAGSVPKPTSVDLSELMKSDRDQRRFFEE